jgi:hypothetical protein
MGVMDVGAGIGCWVELTEGFCISDVEPSGSISMVPVMNCNLELAKLSRLHTLIISKFRSSGENVHQWLLFRR